MAWFYSGVGVLLVATALRDIFHTLWHPSGFGTICRRLFDLVWRASKVLSPAGRAGDLAGPFGMLAVAGAWTALIVVGWALVYLPHMPDGFYFSSSLRPGSSSDLVAAIYVSLVGLATLGFGDIVPAGPVLRVVAPLQALVGFVLLTAAISWVLQIYPALNRRRALARRLTILSSTDAVDVVATGEASIATQLLDSVAEGVTLMEMDLMQFGETYYFREKEPALSLAAAVSFVPVLAAAGRAAASSEVRQSAAVLDAAADGLAHRLRDVYLGTRGTTQEVFEALAADHRQRPLEPI